MWQFLLSDVIQISQQVAEQTNQLHSMALQALPPPPRIVKEPPTPTHGPPSGMLEVYTSGFLPLYTVVQ